MDQRVSKNRLNQIISICKREGYDPIETMIAIHKEEEMEDKPDKHLQLDIAKAIAPYLYPKLKHVEVDAQVNHGITVQIRQFVKAPREEEITNVEQPAIESGPNPLAGRIPGGFIPAAREPEPLTIDVEAAGELHGHKDILPDPTI